MIKEKSSTELFIENFYKICFSIFSKILKPATRVISIPFLLSNSSSVVFSAKTFTGPCFNKATADPHKILHSTYFWRKVPS